MSIRPFPAGKDCHDFMRDGGQPVPDSDISGFGVILAFTFSAYLTFALVLSSYLFGQVDGSLLNTVDTRVFGIRAFRPDLSRRQGEKPPRFRWSLALRQAILSLSDQQIVTGIAIMSAGFQGLRLGGIDSYHYQTVLYLAWMSSSVHISALSVLAPVLKGRPALRYWRLTGMLVLLVLLIVGLVPTVSNDWGLITWDGMLAGHSGWGVPAVCFWGTTWGDGVNPDAVLGFLILFISYCWKVGGLYPNLCKGYQQWIRYPMQRTFERLLAFTARRCYSACVRNSSTRVYWTFAYRVALSVWVPFFAVFETLASFSTAIWISCLGLIFGTLQIAMPRQQNQPYLGANESTWGFGQLVPLILLIQPFGAVWEVLIIDTKSVQEEALEEQDHEINSSEAAASKDATHMVSLQERHRNATLMNFLLEYRTMQRTERTFSQPTPVEQIVLQSRTFCANVYLIQPAIVAAAILAFYADSYWIGYSRTDNWMYFIIVLGVYVGAAWILTFCMAPWSNLGRLPRTWRIADGSGSGATCNDIGLDQGFARPQPP